MVRYLSAIWPLYLLGGFHENWFYGGVTDGLTTDDRDLFDGR